MKFRRRIHNELFDGLGDADETDRIGKAVTISDVFDWAIARGKRMSRSKRNRSRVPSGRAVKNAMVLWGVPDEIDKDAEPPPWVIAAGVGAKVTYRREIKIAAPPESG